MECEECRREVEALRTELGALGEVGVPEPPGMYWEALRRQIGHRLEGESRRVAWRQWFVPLAAAATVVFSLMVGAPRGELSRPAVASTLPAWSALPSGDEDTGLVVLQALADEGQLSGSASCDEVAACVESLSDDDAATFVNVLRGELRGRKL